jgi:UDP-3-O-[3-hydroxymyristoyl] glucosamine N-acyltransferase
MKLSELAAKVGAQLENYTTDVEIRGLAPVEEAEGGQIAYVGSPAEWRAAKHSGASALITVGGLTGSAVPRLCGEDPYLLFARVVEIFHTPLRYEKGIHSTAVIHDSAGIGANASIGAYVVIDRDVTIGADAVLLPHVVIYRGARIGNNFFAHAHAVVREYCQLGDNVVLQNGAVIGTDGFGFVKEAGGDGVTWKKVLHTGSVILGDDVEVQSNACINRSDDGDTHIGSGVKIGDLVHVAHKASVAACSLVLPQAALAGRTRVGKNVIIAGQAGVAGNCEIADDAVVMSQSGVIGHIGAGKVVSGFPAICHKDFLRSFAVFQRLPELTQGLRRASSGSVLTAPGAARSQVRRETKTL